MLKAKISKYLSSLNHVIVAIEPLHMSPLSLHLRSPLLLQSFLEEAIRESVNR